MKGYTYRIENELPRKESFQNTPYKLPSKKPTLWLQFFQKPLATKREN